MQMPGLAPFLSGRQSIRKAVLLAAALALSACTSLPKLDRQPLASSAQSLSMQTLLGRLAQASVQTLEVGPDAVEATDPPTPAPKPRMPDGSAQGLSGFRLLPLGPHALDVRLQLVRRAEASLDLQYYHFAADSTGRALMRALRDASERGVRVRVLIDDLYTAGADALWLGLAAHAGVQVRLFNPITTARNSGPRGCFASAPATSPMSTS